MSELTPIVASVALVTVSLLILVSGWRWTWKQVRKMLPPIWHDESDQTFGWRCPMCGCNYDEEGQVMK